MEKYKKVDSGTAEVTITKTVTETETIKLVDLINERDSIIRTKNMETDEFNARMAKLDVIIEEMNAKIKKLTDIGLSTEVISPDVQVEEVIEVDPKIKELREAPQE